jgi:hypothetical protein
MYRPSGMLVKIVRKIVKTTAVYSMFMPTPSELFGAQHRVQEIRGGEETQDEQEPHDPPTRDRKIR